MGQLDCVALLPVQNIESTVVSTVQSWLAELQNHLDDSFRLLVINAGSSDNTGALLDNLTASHPGLQVLHINRSVGLDGAILSGFQKATYLNPRFVVQLGAKSLLHLSDFRFLWEGRRYGKFVLGCRLDQPTPALTDRLLGARDFLLKSLLGLDCPDPDSPFCLFKTDFLKSLLETLPENTVCTNLFLTFAASHFGETFFLPLRHSSRTSVSLQNLEGYRPKQAFKLVVNTLGFWWGLRHLEEPLDESTLESTLTHA